MKLPLLELSKSAQIKILILIKLTVFSLVISSIVTSDWINQENITGSLFSCTSGEYSGQQYLRIYCYSSTCIYHKLGKAGIAYLIFSIFSLMILVAWIIIAVFNIKSSNRLDTWLKYFLSLGSALSYYFGIIAWTAITGILFNNNQSLPLGPILCILCIILYPLCVFAFFVIFRNDEILLETQKDTSETPQIIDDNPVLKSIVIEGKIVYPESFIEENNS